MLLDGSDLAIEIGKKATGQELMEKIHYQMDIIEKDYFGLQYTDHNHVSHWLDPFLRERCGRPPERNSLL